MTAASTITRALRTRRIIYRNHMVRSMGTPDAPPYCPRNVHRCSQVSLFCTDFCFVLCQTLSFRPFVVIIRVQIDLFGVVFCWLFYRFYWKRGLCFFLFCLYAYLVYGTYKKLLKMFFFLIEIVFFFNVLLQNNYLYNNNSMFKVLIKNRANVKKKQKQIFLS